MMIGEKIRELRIKNNLSQDELAKLVGYNSRSAINKIEKGVNDITQSKIVLFAKALNTTPAELLDWCNESTNTTQPDNVIDLNFCTEIEKQFADQYKKIPESKREDFLKALMIFIDMWSEKENN